MITAKALKNARRETCRGWFDMIQGVILDANNKGHRICRIEMTNDMLPYTKDFVDELEASGFNVMVNGSNDERMFIQW
jgi:hypothetical protein